MANKLYNQKTVATNTASVGDKGGIFTYKGFNSRESSKNYKIYDIDLVKQDLIKRGAIFEEQESV